MDGSRIALMAHARAGKDHVGKYLWLYHDFTRMAFADRIKEITQDLFPGEFEDGKPRELFQWFGQTMRQRDPEVWIKYVLRRVEESDKFFKNRRFVITDLRLPNEHAALKAAGFAIVKVEASLETRIRRMEAAGDKYNPQDLTHETESHIDKLPADFVIKNDEDGDGYQEKIRDVLRSLGAI